MNKIDIFIVILCIFTLSVAMYDLFRLDQIEDKCLDGCNEHWWNEFKTRCPQNIGNMMVPTTLMNYSYKR